MRLDSRVLLTTFAVLIFCGCNAGVSFAENPCASPTPSRVMVTWKEDPASSFSVTWRTDTSVTKSMAEVAEAGDGPLFVKDSRSVDAVTTPLLTDQCKVHMHAATFRGLKPKTKYAYRVGDGEHWSEWFHFTTAANEAEPFQFVYVGDAQNDIKSHWSRLIRQAYSDAPRALFLLHAGDLIDHANADKEWGEWFYAGGWVFGQIPSIAIPGNHEYGFDEFSPTDAEHPPKRQLSRRWQQRFEFPENGPDYLKESCYYIDVQGVRIIGLNSNEDPEPQAKWLKKVLKDNPQQWTIVTHHHPIHSTSRGRDNPQLREHWQPLYDKYHVDLVLQGHDHTYGRTSQVAVGHTHHGHDHEHHDENVTTGLQGQSKKGGTVYAVSVSGPKQYPLKEYDKGKNPFVRRAEDTQLYQVITIDGDTLRYEARTAIGDLYDAFELKKRPGEINELIEHIPDRPENRRK
ncbi:purple acid phosphatase family protein [Calycomorphotria hydatis]|uniref:Calcineurin-like phosphoesterase n=1 Tax=Calycomorphotria hydatis TaxID=2528027 RepID=A0A517T544_9PLAN|nr:metallophosphoesterase family protein [Calycomorphotria hydatis]QDT63495.1 Calcineurin-like phosphoesterase [Calycomorphotria hydatis]